VLATAAPTRTGWYSKSVRGDTASVATGDAGGSAAADGAWSGQPIAFPLIQGADCCGEIVAVGDQVPTSRTGERVLVRALQSTGATDGTLSTWTLGSDQPSSANSMSARSCYALHADGDGSRFRFRRRVTMKEGTSVGRALPGMLGPIPMLLLAGLTLALVACTEHVHRMLP